MSHKPKSVLWELDPHSKGKHLVLAQYLAGWIRIVGTGVHPLQIIDGFAGPGEYTNNADGSPVIMLQQALVAPPPKSGKPVHFYFMEENAKRVAHLKELLERRFPNLPPHVRYAVAQQEFTALAHLPVVAAGNLVPSFIMIDPFGVSHTPMQVLNQLMQSRSCELYVSVMLDYVARFSADPTWEVRLNELFGTTDWIRPREDSTHELRRWYLQDLYEQQLRANGAKYVISFNLWDAGVYKYTIFFATSHPRGCGLMKDSIWKALGSHEYIAPKSNGDPDQLSLPITESVGERDPVAELAMHVVLAFNGTTASVEQLDAWIETDVNIYAPSQLRSALKRLEAVNRLSVRAPELFKRRAGTFPAGRGLAIDFSEDRKLSRVR